MLVVSFSFFRAAFCLRFLVALGFFMGAIFDFLYSPESLIWWLFFEYIQLTYKKNNLSMFGRRKETGIFLKCNVGSRLLFNNKFKKSDLSLYLTKTLNCRFQT